MNIENNKYFSELNEWYDDIDMYNIIGFLHIYGNVSFIEIKKLSIIQMNLQFQN